MFMDKILGKPNTTRKKQQTVTKYIHNKQHVFGNSFAQRQICNYYFKNCNISNRRLLNIHIIDNMSLDNSFAQQQICSYHFKNCSI